MRFLIQVILITLAIHSAGCTDSSDKTLWEQAEYGMTPAQVLKIFPDAQKNPKPTFSQHNNSQSHVIIPTKLIHGVDFKVSFSFNSTGLVEVGFHSEFLLATNCMGRGACWNKDKTSLRSLHHQPEELSVVSIRKDARRCA